MVGWNLQLGRPQMVVLFGLVFCSGSGAASSVDSLTPELLESLGIARHGPALAAEGVSTPAVLAMLDPGDLQELGLDGAEQVRQRRARGAIPPPWLRCVMWRTSIWMAANGGAQ